MLWFRNRIWFTTLLIFTIRIASAQSYYFDNYSTKDGLNSKVTSMVIDSLGYVYLGTPGGLSKFDGKTFTNFTTEDGLAPNGIKSLFIDKNGMLWTGHYSGGGLTVYDGIKFNQITDTSLTTDKDITSIIQDKAGDIWLTTYGDGAFRISYPHGGFINPKIENFKGGGLSDLVSNSLLAHDSTLFVITDLGIHQFIPDSNAFVIYRPEGLTSYFSKTSMLEDRKGNVWYGTQQGGLIKFDGNTNAYSFFDFKDGLETNYIWKIFEDSRGNIWTSNFDPRQRKGGVTRISNKDFFKAFNKLNGLNDNQITCFAEDKSGNILIGTYSKGLSIFKGDHFFHISKEVNNSLGLIDKQVWAVYQDSKGVFWFGTDEGVTIYNPENPFIERFEHFHSNNSNLHNKVRIITEDKNQNIWLGTKGGGVYQYNRKKKTFIQNERINNFIIPLDLMINSLVVDNDNNLWIGTNEGLGYYEINTNRGDRLTQSYGISGNTISSLYLDSKSTLWIGAQGAGITYLENKNDKFKRFKYLSGITPKAFIEDKEGNVWIGTEGQGLYVISIDTIINYFSTQNGLLSNLINQLNIDNEGNIYVGTNLGLNKIITENNNHIITYTKRNGYVGIESKENATLRDKKGRLWFGTDEGAICYDPSKEKKELFEPLTHIKRMTVNNKEQTLDNNLKLKYFQNRIGFEFNSIDLTNPDLLLYQRKLEGLDEDWQEVKINQPVNYSLLPGKYSFKVKAKNSAGIWNDEPATFSFTIKKPFYQTTGFILFSIIFIAAIVFSWIKIRERKLKQENKLLEDKVKERTIELSEAYSELEIKNKDITDSIQYAKRIQLSILPPDIHKNTFVLFRPKDIVSGDFYWFSKMDGKEYFAAVDCTGHGVPGAFMSFIGHTSLNKIVKEYEILEPAKILQKLNDEVRTTLHQTENEGILDGMDLALVCYDINSSELQFSGAYNSLYLIRKKELIEVKADRLAIGRDTSPDKKFTNHTVPIEKNDMIYLFSDGYADQFGGKDGRKLKVRAFKQILLDIHQKDIDEQRSYLDSFIDEWRDDIEQIDDILVIGRKF